MSNRADANDRIRNSTQYRKLAESKTIRLTLDVRCEAKTLEVNDVFFQTALPIQNFTIQSGRGKSSQGFRGMIESESGKHEVFVGVKAGRLAVLFPTNSDDGFLSVPIWEAKNDPQITALYDGLRQMFPESSDSDIDAIIRKQLNK